MTESGSHGRTRAYRRRAHARDGAGAAERLERTLEELRLGAAELESDRAAAAVDDLERSVRRLREELDREDAGRSTECFPEETEPKRANGWLRDLWREPERGWIAGVCAGVARYYEVDAWVARVVAVSLLIFMPQLTFWAYVIAIFMLARRPRMDAPVPGRRRPSSRRSPAPELGPRFAPAPGLRSLRVRFRELELRLRRMEETVTSDAFRLKRELSALEAEGPGRS